MTIDCNNLGQIGALTLKNDFMGLNWGNYGEKKGINEIY